MLWNESKNFSAFRGSSSAKRNEYLDLGSLLGDVTVTFV